MRTAEERGFGLEPIWPAPPDFSGCPHTALGCERLGARRAEYLVHFETEPGRRGVERWTCPFPETRWESIVVGSRWQGRVSRIRGELDCEDLHPTD